MKKSLAASVLAACWACEAQQTVPRPPAGEREFRVTPPAVIATVKPQDPAGRLGGEDLRFLEQFHRLADSLKPEGYFVAVTLRDTIRVTVVDSFHLAPWVIPNTYSAAYGFFPGHHPVSLPATWPMSAWLDGLKNWWRLPREARGAVAIRATSVKFKDVSVGWGQTCGLDTTGKAFCWGANVGASDTSRPVAVATTRRFLEISAGVTETCARTMAGETVCWSSFKPQPRGPEPQPVSAYLHFVELSTGNAYACGRVTDGRAFCWGSNGQGQFGDGTSVASNTSPVFRRAPVAVSGRLRFVEIGTGGFHACGRTANGRAYCWGFNSHGELGDGTKTSRSTPVAVVGGLRFSAVRALGQGHTCSLAVDGRAFCWGENSAGQLGDSTTVDRPTPVAVAGGLRFVELTAATSHTCGRMREGRVYCWGGTNNGERGDGVMRGSPTTWPVQVAGGLRFVTVRAGGVHSCGLTKEGAAFCWGSNDHGELGDGTRSPSLGPVQVVP